MIIDDLGSELDEVFYNELLKFLSLSENQLFFSNISDVFNSKIVNSDLISQKFHVEQFSKWQRKKNPTTHQTSKC